MQGPARLRAWIQKSRLTQRQVARIFGVHYTFVNQLLSGRRQPGLANAVVIKRETGISVDAWMPARAGKPAKASSGASRKRRVD